MITDYKDADYLSSANLASKFNEIIVKMECKNNFKNASAVDTTGKNED